MVEKLIHCSSSAILILRRIASMHPQFDALAYKTPLEQTMTGCLQLADF
jgi:hypothetical protein